MAEIRVEPKRGGLGWVWLIIALIVVALLVWYFMGNRDAVTTTGLAPQATTVLALAERAADTIVRLAA
jgi:hypothetical protein